MTVSLGNTIVASNVTAPGTGQVFGPGKRHISNGYTRCLHIEAAGTFTAQVRGTNFVTFSSSDGQTLVASNWTNVGSPITASGLYRFDTNLEVQLYHVQFTAVSGGRVDAVVF